MAILPETPRGFWDDLAPVFTRPTLRRFLTLMGAAILTVGRRTVSNLLRTAGSLAAGASSGYRRVFGKARHRDPVRSSHAFTAWRYGHKWVVLAVVVRFPFAARPWASPVLVALLYATRPTTDADGGGIARRRSRRSGSFA